MENTGSMAVRVGGVFLLACGLAIVCCKPVLAVPKPLPSVFGVTTESSAERYRRFGEEALARRDWRNARRNFEKSLELNPNLAMALVGLGRVAMGQDRRGAAERYFQEALSIQPRRPEVEMSWGRYLFLGKRFDEAEVVLRSAARDPTVAVKAYLDLADVYLLGKKELGKAIECFRAVIAIDPGHAGAHYGLGRTLLRLKRFEEAAVELKKAAELTPRNPLPYGTLGSLYIARGQYDKALRVLAGATRAQPYYLPAYFMRGEIYFKQEKYARALIEYVAVNKIDPKNAEAYLRRGFVYDRQNKSDDAMRAFLRTIELDPQQPIAYNNVAWISALRGVNLDQALIWSKKSLELSPNNPGFLDTLGWVHRVRGELPEAQVALEKALAASKNPPAEILYHLGVVHQEQGRKREAASYLRKALATESSFEYREDARRRLNSLSKASSPTVKVVADGQR